MCKLCFWNKPDPEPIEEPEPIEGGDKYALLVGINKYRPDLNCDLQGCVNDVENVRQMLIDDFSFDPDNIRVLTDSRATKDNIINRLTWLLQHDNGELVFHYSGHGSQVRDRNGDELNDGLDEILCPYDMDFDNPLTDDILGELFNCVPLDSFLTCIIDACHSGTMTRNTSEYNKPRYLKPPRDIQLRSESRELKVKKIGTRAVLNHVLLSGCQDSQTSADAYLDNTWQGAFTASLTSYIDSAKTWQGIYDDVLCNIQSNGFSQTPSFNGRELNTRLIFGGN